MNKNEFMERLKEKLSKLSVEDREDAINYYWEYFEEAGFGEESDVTKNVGNPEDVAAKIIRKAKKLRKLKKKVILTRQRSQKTVRLKLQLWIYLEKTNKMPLTV